MKITNKKGLIFGLDARITLIIIAVVSGIGFQLTKTKIKDVAEYTFVEQIVTLRKAALQNIADNGFDFSVGAINLNDNLFGIKRNATTTNLKLNKNNYQYINSPDTQSTSGKIVISGATGTIDVNTDNLFASVNEDGLTSATTDCANTSSTCFYWFRLTNVPEEYYVLLEEHFDGSTSEADAFTSGIVVIPGQDLTTFTGDVLINLGER
ncbi:MAG: hypothetical protein GY793_07875 [Proteobacteria bacterium]|nr:hypothetical protein [Pseudomonadota bacterium]